MYDKAVVVTKKTPLEELRVRYGTDSQARFVLEKANACFEPYLKFADKYARAVAETLRFIPDGVRVAVIDSSLLPTYQFDPNCVVATIGPDGLAVNTAKYLSGQPLVAINPDPMTIDGKIASCWPSELGSLLQSNVGKKEYLTMAEATLPDGQRILAMNDLFIGHASHQSARYVIEHEGSSERQSSSGIIVSTGTGSTGWRRSVMAGAAGLLESLGLGPEAEHIRSAFEFPRTSEELRFYVREPFPSGITSTSLTTGTITKHSPLIVQSEMPTNGVIFSDGVESDFLSFNSGDTATIRISEQRTLLWSLFRVAVGATETKGSTS
jgi:hypothetical protein